jgi:hypothetical protein
VKPEHFDLPLAALLLNFLANKKRVVFLQWAKEAVVNNCKLLFQFPFRSKEYSLRLLKDINAPRF